jgi:hypothetical protein
MKSLSLKGERESTRAMVATVTLGDRGLKIWVPKTLGKRYSFHEAYPIDTNDLKNNKVAV